jgi:hypothetical protein
MGSLILKLAISGIGLACFIWAEREINRMSKGTCRKVKLAWLCKGVGAAILFLAPWVYGAGWVLSALSLIGIGLVLRYEADSVGCDSYGCKE